MESSLKKVTTFRVGGQLQDVNIHAESVKDDTEMNNGNPELKLDHVQIKRSRLGILVSWLRNPINGSILRNPSLLAIMINQLHWSMKYVIFPSWYSLQLYTVMALSGLLIY